MPLGILGKKIGMTNSYSESGRFLPITLVEAGPCYIGQIKTNEKDKYSAIQMAFDKKREKVFSKPKLGHFRKFGFPPCKFVKELRVDPSLIKDFKPGQEIKVSAIFKVGDTVNVIGTSKGKGFQGVVRRHHFRGNPAGHGTHEYFRHPGSIGCRFPQHTAKGKRFPGQMGNKRVKVKNLKVLEVLEDKNLLVIEGALPGSNNSYVVIEKAN